jgi:hypothetical protein
MTREAWLKHRTEVLSKAYGESKLTPEEASVFMREHAKDCRDCKARARTHKANRNARERDGAMRSLGLTKTPYGWE